MKSLITFEVEVVVVVVVVGGGGGGELGLYIIYTRVLGMVMSCHIRNLMELFTSKGSPW